MTATGSTGSATNGGERREPIASLVAEAKQGDRNAFASLYRARLGAVGRYVAAIVRDPTRSEDVVAQTFLLAWQDLPKLRKNDRFDAWLFRIAHNQAISEVRHRPTTPLEDAPEIEDDDRFVSPEGSLSASHEAEAMRDSLMQLPEAQREVIQLRFFRDLPSAEIARRMEKTEQAVWALQYRALANLRRLVDRDSAGTLFEPAAEAAA